MKTVSENDAFGCVETAQWQLYPHTQAGQRSADRGTGRAPSVGEEVPRHTSAPGGAPFTSTSCRRCCSLCAAPNLPTRTSRQ